MTKLIEVPQETKPINESVARLNKRRTHELRLGDAIAKDDRSEVDVEIAASGFADADDYIILFEVVWLLGKEKRQMLGFELSMTLWDRKLRRYLVDAELVDIAKQKIMAFYEDKMDWAYHLAMLAGLLSDLFDLRSEAEALFNKALSIEIEPLESVIVMNKFGLALLNWVRYQEAETVLLKEIEINPDYIPAHWNLARTLWRQGRYDEANVSHLKVIELIDGHDNLLPAYTWISVATISKKQKHYDAAKEAYQKSIELDSSIASAWSGLAYCLNIEGDRAGAEAAYRRALAINGNNSQNWLYLAILLSSSPDNYLEAIDAYQKVLSLKSNLSQSEIETISKAIAHFSKMACVNYLSRGNDFFGLGQFEEAEPFFRKALELDPSSFDAQMSLGELLLKTDRQAEADVIYRKIIDAEPDVWASIADLLVPTLLDFKKTMDLELESPVAKPNITDKEESNG